MNAYASVCAVVCGVFNSCFRPTKNLDTYLVTRHKEEKDVAYETKVRSYNQRPADLKTYRPAPRRSTLPRCHPPLRSHQANY